MKTIDERLIEATRGNGIGANVLHAYLTVERRDGRIDWREAALALAQAADRMHKQAVEALTFAPAPLIIVPPCHGAQPCAQCQDERGDFSGNGRRVR